MTAWTRGSSEASSRVDRGRADRADALDRVVVEVDADHVAARRGEEPRRELPDEPEPDHPDRRAELRLGLADAVQRDGADGRVGGVLEGDAVGHWGDEVPRHGEDLGVVRALAAAGDAVAGRDALDPFADLEHDPGGRVADRGERLEPVARGVERGADPLDARLVHDLLDEVGAGARLLEQVLLAGDDLRPLGAGADQRDAVRDEQPAGPERRGGHVDDADGAVLRALGDLLHRAART